MKKNIVKQRLSCWLLLGVGFLVLSTKLINGMLEEKKTIESVLNNKKV